MTTPAESTEPKSTRFLSVGRKLAGATIALMIVVAIGVYIGFSRYQRENLLQAKEMAGIAVTRLFADSCVAPVVFEDDSAVEEALTTLGRNREVEYAAVFRTEGPTRVGQRIAKLARGQGETLRDVPSAIRIERQANRVVITSPVVDQDRQVVAVASVAFSLASENLAIAQMASRTLALSSALALGLSMLLMGMVRQVIVHPLGKLVVAAKKLEEGTSVEVEVGTNDEVGQLASAFRSMAQAITVREERISARNRDMRLVLDNVDQGFITLDREGVVSEERSRIVDTWFGDASGAPRFWSYLARTDQSVGEWFQLGWDAILDQWLPLEVCLDQLPKSVCKGEATFELAYRPILRGEQLDKLIVVITEVTARIARERADQAHSELMSVFRHILADRPAFEQFFVEATGLVEAITRFDGGDVSLLKRAVHTLKGNCALFDLDSIVSYCHDLESWMSESGQAIDEKSKQNLRTLWARVSEKRAQLTRDAASNRIEIEREEYEAFRRDLSSRVDCDPLLRCFASWEFEPVSKRLELMAEQLRRIAARLGKAPVDVVCQPTALRLPPSRWNVFWSVFAHVIRNTVDHGIETAEERSASGKAAHALVTLAASREGQQLVVSIQDDGRGVDWPKIASRAQALGLPHTSRRDLEQALFADGVTSRNAATSTSGRGVGLSALREALDQLGGRAEVRSEPGQGTLFRFVLPLSLAFEARDHGSAAA